MWGYPVTFPLNQSNEGTSILGNLWLFHGVVNSSKAQLALRRAGKIRKPWQLRSGAPGDGKNICEEYPF